MRLFRDFDPESSEIIQESLSFVKSGIEKYRIEKKRTLNEVHHNVINEEIGSEVVRIEKFETFLKEGVRKVGFMDEQTYEIVMDVIRSALEIYLKDTMEAKTKSGLNAFDTKIQEIRQVISLGDLKDRKTDLYNKYFEAPIISQKGEKVEVFLSYSHKDRVLAGKIAALLIKKGIGVFLAHEDIEVSEEWREEIFQHLKNCTVLLALLTTNYEQSVWANQEAGYMRGKGGKVIPLIVKETDIRRFGFLEALQGILVKEENLDNCVEEILSIIFR